MGLSIVSVEGDEIFSGAYSAFHRFRTEVAKLIGFKSYVLSPGEMVYEMTGTILPGKGLTVTGIQKKKDQRANWFKKFPSHRAFFLHSDCDGEWSVEELKDVQKVLKGAKNHCKDSSFKEQIQSFLDGVEMCIEKGFKVEFH